MNHPLPRIAVISMTSLSCSNATGSLLATLFHDWPPENLLQISTNIPEDEVTSSYTQIFRPKSGGDIPPLLGGPVLRRTRLADMYCFNWENLLKTVRQFKPDILYARIVGYPLFFTDISYKLARNLKLPMACHIMDDYERLFAASPNPFERYIIKPIFAHRLYRLLNQSGINFAISAKMAEAFSNRYNISFTPLHNGIDPSLWAQEKMKDVSRDDGKNVFRLVLAGALAPEKEGAVARPLAQAIDTLNREGKSKYELVLNTQEHYLPFAKKLAEEHYGVIAQDYISVQDYRRLLQRADLLVLARNFDERSKAYTEYSFQNKLPEYMASGTPILCIGPTWENSIQFLEHHLAGKTLTDCSPQKIQTTIKEFCQNPQSSQALAEKAKHIAFTEFNINTIRENFQHTMYKLAGLS